MNQSVINLVNAIKTGDALATEQAFSDAMADKIGAAIDARRQEIASNMFNTQEEVVEEEMIISEEEYNSLSEEEKAEWNLYEIDEDLDEASMVGAIKTVMKNKGLGDDTHGRYDTPRATQAAARKKVVAAKKVIKKGGGDWNKVAAKADAKTERENEM